MKTIEQAREWLAYQANLYKGIAPQEDIYLDALRLANKNQGVGFLLAALYNRRERLEYTHFESSGDRKSAYQTHDSIVRGILS